MATHPGGAEVLLEYGGLIVVLGGVGGGGGGVCGGGGGSVCLLLFTSNFNTFYHSHHHQHHRERCHRPFRIFTSFFLCSRSTQSIFDREGGGRGRRRGRRGGGRCDSYVTCDEFGGVGEEEEELEVFVAAGIDVSSSFGSSGFFSFFLSFFLSFSSFPYPITTTTTIRPTGKSYSLSVMYSKILSNEKTRKYYF